MRALLIPVKEFAAAKTRLAGHFTAEARAALAAALCQDFFDIAAQVTDIDGIFVVSKERQALAWAAEHGWDCIVESEQISESHSVDAASRLCATRGVTALLRIPADLPLARPQDIAGLFAAMDMSPSCVIVPSREGTGTNALLRSPPVLFPSHFGPGSFALHLAEAERCGAALRIMQNARLALDVDEPEDVQALPGQIRPDCATAEWLRTFI